MALETHRLAPTETAGYMPRRADETLLYGVVAIHLEAFLARARHRGRVVPRFVVREFRKFLECGIPAHGFARAPLGALSR